MWGFRQNMHPDTPMNFQEDKRQRIGIARALIVEPQLVIADEPVSALDVSVQAQVINLLNKLKQEMGLTILFIAHNLSVVKYFSDRIGVMYFGKLVEMADSNELFKNPLHPYTKALLSAIPEPDPLNEKKRVKLHYDPEIHHYGEGKQPSYHEVSRDIRSIVRTKSLKSIKKSGKRNSGRYLRSQKTAYPFVGMQSFKMFQSYYRLPVFTKYHG